MKTYAFIGSDKNAGKTTTLNFIYRYLRKVSTPCVTSIGLNGEKIDQYEQKPKPSIMISPGSFFITASEHLKNEVGCYLIYEVFGKPDFKKQYILATPLKDLSIVLEGPNEKSEIAKMKRSLKSLNSCNEIHIDNLLIDGSIDRHFLGHPEICDAFFYSLLISERSQQQEKAKQLLAPLSFPLCAPEIRNNIYNDDLTEYKSVLFNTHGELLYKGHEIPFLDQKLQNLIISKGTNPLSLYLNGSLSRGLYQFLSPFRELQIILNNFTLYQNIHTKQLGPIFLPTLKLIHPVNVIAIFLKEESLKRLPFPQGVPVYNLFREENLENELRINDRP